MEKIGRLLVDDGVLSEDQLSAALQEQAQTNDLLGAILVRRGLVSEQQLVDALTRQLNLQPASLDTVEFDSSLTQLVSAGAARRGRCVPVRKTATTLELAMLNPEDTRTIDRIAQQTGLQVTPLVAGPESIERALTRLYGAGGPESAPPSGQGAAGSAQQAGGRAKPAAQGGGREKKEKELVLDAKALGEQIQRAIQEHGSDAKEKDEKPEEKEIPRLEVSPTEQPIVRLVNAILLQAIAKRASDIHIEPLEEEIRVRYRIDGSMVETQRFPNSLRQALTSRIKILCSLDIAEKRKPQDGAIKYSLSDKEQVDFRVSTVPSIYGEKIVMRVLGRGQLKGSVDQLGLRGRALEQIRDAVANPYGMILVTGPTGSGKTTTLYTILQQLNEPDVNILTAEDPVEYRLEGITQVNVKPSVGVTFEAVLRAFLRQDPDVVLVGEMRDFETAAIAVKAALTGHLVLSTLHTNDTASTVVRLVDMGIEPYLVASAVKLVVAQRLVKKICENCKEEVSVTEAEKTDADRSTLAAIERMFRGKGCDACNNSGYKGRMPIFEVMSIKSRDMRRAITEGGTEVQVQQIAKREGLRTLADEALDLVNQGVTSLEEALQHIMTD
ncbi:MAG: Flp pilus assembly complex ATPase component TadA [Planctomycetes bacterium]|nr:Flp pilus assembly complex ATPase component TadA [Planctomycetota bacterium]